MRLIVVRESAESSAGGRMNLLRYALSTNPLDRAVREGVDHLWRRGRSLGGLGTPGGVDSTASQWVLPGTWCADLPAGHQRNVSYEDFQTGVVHGYDARGDGPWVIVTEGRFATCLDLEALTRLMAATDAEVMAVNATSDLLAYRERVRLTPDNEVAGFRRLFADGASRTPVPTSWPHHLLVRPRVFESLVKPSLLGSFSALVDQCRAQGIRMQAVDVAGTAFDLESEEGILAVCEGALDHVQTPREVGAAGDSRRFIGPVLVGERVIVEPGAVVAGPAILCDDSVVGRGAVVDASIVGPRVRVDPGRVVRNRLATTSEPPGSDGKTRCAPARACVPQESAFRSWSRFSYVRCFKRAMDVLAATFVLVLFAPVFPVIALAVRMSSPGPVFFRDKRQGFHGRMFGCIKFRTMRQGADKIQEKLRFVCEVDGPQFKMADDPRITTVGRFLRETYLDEIPQFFNVLCGQMSVVGPRPSPESENTLCPLWRDARLSVRPGITGLWQVRRTRAEHKDFQEWIHYDTQYVRDLSPGLDLWICWRTFRRMVENFVNQF
ncbi:MAG TPA: sugar transferase [Sedimentisphaerales bacterium]|nr:sugar transferase [Sedimentisphaerales bacterium]HNU29417.1 sugar transferase [Sedimentisphaerales bacterium]